MKEYSTKLFITTVLLICIYLILFIYFVANKDNEINKKSKRKSEN